MTDIAKTIAGIEQRAAGIIKAEQGDFVLDGLLHCGKCGTPKQVRITVLDMERTPYCLCKCEAEKRDREEAERKRIERVHELRRVGLPEAKMHGWTFANDDRANERVSAVAMKYAENFDKMKEDGKGLLLFGAVGTGKSYAAACVANALIDKCVPCYMTNLAGLINTVSGMYDGKQAYIDGLNRFSLLVLDDLATEAGTEYRDEMVFNIIDSRYRAGLPVIVTTNLTGEELKNTTDIRKQRIYSRLLEMTIPLEVKGADRRREVLRGDFKEYSDLLGL